MANDIYQDDGNQAQFEAGINMMEYIAYMIDEANQELKIINNEVRDE